MSVYRHKQAMLAIVDGLVDNTSFSRETEAQRNSCFELAEELRHAIAAGERIERLEAALREVGNTAPPRWGDIARKALEEV